MFFSCTLCGRKASVGLLSRAAWGEIEVNGGVERACPTCREEHSDWDRRLLGQAGGAASSHGDEP